MPLSFLCGHISVFIVFLVIIAAASPVEMTTLVPFYLRNHVTKLRSDAMARAKEVADFSPYESGAIAEREIQRFALEVLYVLEDDSSSETIFTYETILLIKELEDKIMGVKDYDTFCALAYHPELDEDATCIRPTSMINFFDKNFWRPNFEDLFTIDLATMTNCNVITAESAAMAVGAAMAAASGLSTPAIASAAAACDNCCRLLLNTKKVLQSSTFEPWNASTHPDLGVANVERVLTYWSDYNTSYCTSPEMCAETGIQHPVVIGKISKDGNMLPVEVPNYFWQVSGTEFGTTPGEIKGVAARSKFYFGAPLRGYKTVQDRWNIQSLDMQEFLGNSFEDMLANHKIPGVRIMYNGGDEIRFKSGGDSLMKQAYVQAVLRSDMKFLIGSIIFVFVYMAWMTGSFFLTSMALSMVFLTFIPAVVLYGVVCSSYFGTLNMLAIFIMLGIGADDVFLMLDCWAQTSAENPAMRYPEKMSITLRHAGKAMLCTSATTFFAFVANAQSSFPAVYTYGIWCACLVFVNFCAVVTMYPAVIAVYDRYLYRPAKADVSKAAKLTSIVPSSKAKAKPVALDNVDASPVALGKGSTANQAKYSNPPAEETSDVLRPVERYFRDSHYPFIKKAKFVIIAGFALFSTLALYFALKLDPDPETPKVFPDDNNYMVFGPAKSKHFARYFDPYRVRVWTVFGIDRSAPIDRTGTLDTSEFDYGKVRWTEFAELVEEPDVQQWLLDICDDMRNGADADRTDEGLGRWLYRDGYSNPVSCIVESFRDWCLETGRAFPVPKEQFLSTRVLFMRAHVAPSSPLYKPGATWYDVYSDEMGAQYDHEQIETITTLDGTEEERSLIVPRFMFFTADLDATFLTPYGDGIKLYERWESWINDWLDAGVDRPAEWDAKKGIKWTPAVMRNRSPSIGGFVCDKAAFHYYYLQSTIIAEAFFGIGLALGLSYAVMTLATMNIVISTLAVSLISVLVTSVIAFTYLVGWKLGVLEAIIYVMVIGLSIDYVVHCSDAYLEAGEPSREARTKIMLTKMGVSIISGAFSTMGASFFLVFATVRFFVKFGLIIFCVIFLSLVLSLVVYPAILLTIGPQKDFGKICLPCGRGSEKPDKLKGDGVGDKNLRVSEVGFKSRQLSNPGTLVEPGGPPVGSCS